MRSFTRLAVIGGLVTALGLAAEASAQEEVFEGCPEGLQAALDKLAEEVNNQQIAIVVPFGDTQSAPIRCVSSSLAYQTCDNTTVGEPNSCGPQTLESIAVFSVGANNDRVCWYPVGGTGGCSTTR